MAKRDAALVDVRRDDAGAVLDEVPGVVGGDLAEALDGDGPALQGIGAEHLAGAGLGALVQPVSGDDLRAAQSAHGLGQTGGVGGLLAHLDDVIDNGAHVLGGEEPAAQGVDEAAVGAEQRLGLVGAGVADDERLAAAEVESGEGGLVGHGAGEPQHVDDGLLLGGEGPHACAAAGGAERGVVDADERPQARLLVGVHRELFVVVLVHVVEYVHGWTSFRRAGVVRMCRRPRLERVGVPVEPLSDEGVQRAVVLHERRSV